MLRVNTIILLLAVTFVVSCEREERTFRVETPYVNSTEVIPLTNFYAGGSPPATHPFPGNNYEENAYTLAEGKRLFMYYNCVGCHAQGGGGMGPALMDDRWIYGSEPAQVFASIIQGRPNGMPSFSGRVPDFQIWWLSAYVRSMSGLAASAASPGRSEHQEARPAENSMDKPAPTTARAPQQ
jgi:cytochrome c oxidase cbb3-type subunit III